jgi:hypothetical protein
VDLSARRRWINTKNTKWLSEQIESEGLAIGLNTVHYLVF